MSRSTLFTALIALTMVVGCKAQTPAPAPTPVDLSFNRRVEILVRSQFNVPPDYSVIIGARTPSSITGYDTLPVVISRAERKIPVEFLISTDGKTLARLDKFNLSGDPAFNINTAGRPSRGNPNAKVTVINFDDLECPYCARMHESLFPTTMERYKDKVRFVYKDNPLTEIHPWAVRAAINANCLAAQNTDAYWSYVDYLHGHGDEVNGTDRKLATAFATLDRLARQEATKANFDSTKQTQLEACIAKQDDSEVRTSMQEAALLHIQEAPDLYINGERVEGAQPVELVWAVIDRALKDAGIDPPPPTSAQHSAAGK